MRILRAAVAVTVLTGCYSARVGIGVGADTDGRPSLELSAGIGLGSPGNGLRTVLVASATRGKPASVTPVVVLANAWTTPRSPGADELPRRILSAELRLGEQLSQQGPDATVVGLGAAYLIVLGDHEYHGEDDCLFGYFPTVTLHTVGVAVATELRHGSDDHSRGLGTVSLVYEVGRYEVADVCSGPR